MNEIFKTVLLTSVLMVSMISCNNEELFEEAIAGASQNDEAQQIFNASFPCAFALNNVEPNSTVTIDCILDLEGKTITLPENVTLDYQGGDIINGTINFAANSVIDGNILNSSLAIGGSSPQTKNRTFRFVPSRWGIVEGKVSDDVAARNTAILESIMFQSQLMGVITFTIGKMDAYFKVDVRTDHKPVPTEAAINLPSDFHLLMGNNTHIRMQPNNWKRPALLSAHLVSNVIVEGGVLHGDRDEHDYDFEPGTHEWGHTFIVSGSQNVTLKNVTFTDATGDGISVQAYGHAFDSFYSYCENVLITECNIIRPRRNGIAIVDGRNVVVDNNNFIDMGIDTDKSNGTAPRMGIDIEPHNHSGRIYQIIKDIKISNNTQSGTGYFSFFVAAGSDVVIDNNTVVGPIGYYGAENLTISNNTISGETDRHQTQQTGLEGGSYEGPHTNYNNKIYGNKISNYSTGISILNFDHEIFDNEVIDCRYGMKLSSLENTKIYNNAITSSHGNSEGITVTNGAKTFDNVLIENNKIDVVLTGFKFFNINENYPNLSFSVKNNKTKSYGGSTFNYTSGMKFTKNQVAEGLRFENSRGLTIAENIIEITGRAAAINLAKNNSNFSIENNRMIGSCMDFGNSSKDIYENNNSCE